MIQRFGPISCARTVCAARHRRSGFTLLEAALTTVIIGTGLVAMLQLIAAGTAANVSGAEMTSATNLAKNVREYSLKQTVAQVRALDGDSYTPPIDSRGEQISGFDNWTQLIDVQAVDRDRLTTDIIDANPHAVRVTVKVQHNGRNVCDMSWYRFKPMP